MAIRRRFQAFLFKNEPLGSEGIDALPTPGADALKIDGEFEFSNDPEIVGSDEVTNSLDAGEFEVGKNPFSFTVPVALKGSGVAETPPEVGAMLKSSSLAENIQAATIPAATPAAASGGTAFSVTIDTADVGNPQNAELPLTEGALVGRPMTLAGNPAVPVTTFCSKYTVAGAIVTIEFVESFNPVLDATTTVIVEKNVTYIPATVNVPAGTAYGYNDGKLWKGVGMFNGSTLTLTSSQRGRLEFSPQGIFLSEEDAAVPGGLVLDATRPPLWKGGKALLNRQQIAVQQLTLNLNSTIALPDNPNSVEGFDPGVITARDIQGNINPLERLVATADVMADFRAGTKRVLHAQAGSVAGNRWALTIPETRYRDKGAGDREGLRTAEIPFSAIGSDSSFYLCFF